MPTITELTSAPRRALPIFYVLDTSGSMSGAPIERLNHAMEETIDALKQVAAHNGDAQLKVAVLEFNSTVRWLQPAGPEDMEDFIWQDLSAGGMTAMGAALTELDSKLSRNGFLSSAAGSLYPVIIFMTDGMANDDYEGPLKNIRQNKFFKHAVKVGFAIGDNADAEMIAKAVGDSEAVIKTDDLALFARLMRFVSVTSSTMASVSHTAETDINGASVVQAVIAQEEIEQEAIDPGVTVTIIDEPDDIDGDDGDDPWNFEEW